MNAYGIQVRDLLLPVGTVLRFGLGEFLPDGTALIYNPSVCGPVEQPVPGKGNFFREELSKYEVNAFISFIYSIDLAFNEALIKQYYKLYNLNFSVLEDSALINIYQKLVLVNLYLNDFEKASSYLDRIEGKDKNNLFMLTNRVLVKYKINNFPLLFKKYKYSSMPEFIAIEERVSLLKDFDLINDLYNFKHKYLGYRVK